MSTPRFLCKNVDPLDLPSLNDTLILEYGRYDVMLTQNCHLKLLYPKSNVSTTVPPNMVLYRHGQCDGMTTPTFFFRNVNPLDPPSLNDTLVFEYGRYDVMLTQNFHLKFVFLHLSVHDCTPNSSLYLKGALSWYVPPRFLFRNVDSTRSTVLEWHISFTI